MKIGTLADGFTKIIGFPNIWIGHLFPHVFWHFGHWFPKNICNEIVWWNPGESQNLMAFHFRAALHKPCTWDTTAVSGSVGRTLDSWVVKSPVGLVGVGVSICYPKIT